MLPELVASISVHENSWSLGKEKGKVLRQGYLGKQRSRSRTKENMGSTFLHLPPPCGKDEELGMEATKDSRPQVLLYQGLE